MKNVVAFTVRNTKLFLRDKATFFFSILSALIMILLYFLFIANTYIDGINQNVVAISEDASAFIVYLQMMAGVLVLNSMSLSLGMFTGAAKDFESQKISSFLTTPLKKMEMLISYFIGGVIVSFALNLLTWIITVLLIGMITGYWIFASTFFLVVLVLLVSSLISASIMMLLTAMTKSSTALGVINGVAGTFLGFICGIYMPYSNLGSGVKAIGSIFPFKHLTIWLKNIVLNDAFSQIGLTKETTDVLMDEWFTARSIGFCGFNVPLWGMLLFSGSVAIVCICFSGLLLKKKIKSK